MALAAAVDTMTSEPLGRTTTVLFLGGVCGLVPLLIRRPLSVTPVALPPLAWAGAATFAAVASGQNSGRREVALDVGTMLTITAPVLFGGTMLALLIVLVRLAVRVTRRLASQRQTSTG
jgi:uncharacterized protein DUF6542